MTFPSYTPSSAVLAALSTLEAKATELEAVAGAVADYTQQQAQQTAIQQAQGGVGGP